MLINRDTIGREPLLTREALQRILDAPGLPVVAQPLDAVLATLSSLTSDFLHQPYAAVLPVRALEAGIKGLRAFRNVIEAYPMASSPAPEREGCLEAQTRWIECRLADARHLGRSRGGAPRQLLTYIVPHLLAVYAIIFHKEPHAGSLKQAGPTVRFLRQYGDEVLEALSSAEFNTLAERRGFLKAWRFPATMQTLVQERALRPEPGPHAAAKLDIPGWVGATVLGEWGRVARIFTDAGGHDPYCPPQARGNG